MRTIMGMNKVLGRLRFAQLSMLDNVWEEFRTLGGRFRVCWIARLVVEG